MTVPIMNELSLTYSQITPTIVQSVIARINEKLEWKNNQNFEEIRDWLHVELIIDVTTSTPDNAAITSWSIFTLVCTLTFVIFAR